MERISGHGGAHALAAARQHGVSVMFTLSGGHVFPLYDAAVKTDTPVRLLDVRHEQTAVFAAEATARLTRMPGLAVVTAGPGVTNSVSAVTTALRDLFGNAPVPRGAAWPVAHPIAGSLVWCVALTAVFLPLAIRRYARGER